MVKVGIVGSTGRMGEHLIKNVLENEALELSALHVFDELKVDVPSDVLVTNSMKVIVDLCVVPIGVGVSVSKYVAECQKVLRELRFL